MSFLKNFKKDKSSGLIEGWKELTSEQQLDEIMKDSNTKPVAIFKHSTRCGISTRAKFVLEEDWDYKEEELDFYYLDLIQHRNVSNKIAEVTGVQHQSPQVILIKNGDPVYEETHHAINAKELREYL
jgi:bacillithiol system protein YtxJ